MEKKNFKSWALILFNVALLIILLIFSSTVTNQITYQTNLLNSAL